MRWEVWDMRTDVVIKGRSLSASGALCDRFLESVFFTGNGRMGLRGCALFRPEPRPLDAGLFVAGIFDKLSEHTNLTDFVALPSPRLEISLGGEAARLCSEVERRLDLDTGELRLDYAVSAGGRAVRVTEKRVFPMDEPDRLHMRVVLDGEGELRLSLDTEISNSTIPDDQVKENCELTRMFRPLASDGGRVRFSTRWTGLEIDYALSQRREGNTLDAVCEVRTSRDADPRIGGSLVDISYDAALGRARAQLERRWDDCAVRIDGDAESEAALSWVIYELLANIPARDSTVSVGARGLTHTRYKGCCFWDTEMFVLPFALLTDPEAARNLLGFRVRCLDAAREHARAMNGSGARFPWMDWNYPQDIYTDPQVGNIMSVSVSQHVGISATSKPLADFSDSGLFAPENRSELQKNGIQFDTNYMDMVYNANWGRGYDHTTGTNSRERALVEGTNFEQQWDTVFKNEADGDGGNDVDLVFVTGWNEWIAIKNWDHAEVGYANPTPGMYMVDTFNKEYSRDLEMMKDIHRTVNSAMFDWAGELRDEDKSKGGNLFCRPEFIEQEAERIFSSMRKELLGMMNEVQASNRIARYWGELNALHPFKHENAVTTNLMMQAFVRRHDMELDLSRTSPSFLREAVMSSFEGDVKPLAGIVRSGLRERGRGRN